MILKLLLSAVICTAVYADISTANDAQTCTDLCNGCQGTAVFVDGRCECYIGDADEQGGDCMMRIKRVADEVGLNFIDCEPANGERPARCSCFGKYKRLRTGNADCIVKYFMNGGPMIGPAVRGGAQCTANIELTAPNAQCQPQPIKSESHPEPIAPGASNPSSGHLDVPATQPSPTSLDAHYPATETMAGGKHPPYTPPSQILKERPQTISSPVPIVPPGHAQDLPAATQGPPKCEEVLKLLYQMFGQQNTILERLHHYLPNSQSTLENNRIFYPLIYPNMGPPVQKFDDSRWVVKQKHQASCPPCPSYYLPCPPNNNQFPNILRTPRMSPAVEAVHEGIENIENIEKKEQIEHIQEIEKMYSLLVTTDSPKREARSNANGRKRKKKIIDNNSPSTV